MKRYTIIIAALALLIVLAGCGAGEKEYVWQQFDSEVRVAADGGLRVSETVTLRFSGGPFTYAFRDLPQRRLDAISNIRVSAGEREFRQVDDKDSDEPFTFSVFAEDGGQRIRWVYPPASDSSQTFVVSYEVAGAVRRYADRDEIWWSLVPANRDEPVESARGSLIFSQPVPAADLAASAPDAGGVVSSAPGQVAVQAGPIPTGEELTLRVGFPKGVVGGAQPAWQGAAEAQAAYDANTRPLVNVVLSALAAGMALTLGLGLWAWWRRNRDPRGRGFAGSSLPGQPDDLTPALAAKLLRAQDGGALLATMIDLARRGYLTLHESSPAGIFSQAIIRARRAGGAPRDLAEYERAVLEAVFTDGNDVDLSTLQSLLTKAASALGKATEAELVERGYLDARALARRSPALVASALLLVASGLGLIVATVFAERISWWLPVVPGVAAVLSIAWVIVVANVRGTTQFGADALLRWRAFQRHLRTINPERDGRGQFDRLLAYATALGQPTRLVKAYSRTSEPLPAWYYPIHGSGGSGVGQTLLLQDFSQNFMSALGSAGGSAGAGAAGGGGGASGGGGAGAG